MVAQESGPSFASIITILAIAVFTGGFLRIEVEFNKQKDKINEREKVLESMKTSSSDNIAQGKLDGEIVESDRCIWSTEVESKCKGTLCDAYINACIQLVAILDISGNGNKQLSERTLTRVFQNEQKEDRKRIFSYHTYLCLFEDKKSQLTEDNDGRVGLVVRALAFHQCGPGSISALGVKCGLSLLVLYSAMRGFSPGTPVFPSHQKPTFYLICRK